MGYKRVLKKSFRQIMAHTPIWMHRVLTKRKIAQMTEHLMTQDDLLLGEQNPQMRNQLVEKYMMKYPKQTSQLNRRMKSIYNNAVLEITSDIKEDIAFCWFAYGFYPDEYVFFGLFNQFGGG